MNIYVAKSLVKYTNMHDLPKALAEGWLTVAENASDENYMQVGTVDLINVHFFDENRITQSHIEALREEIANTRAEAQSKVKELENCIQSLLAIAHEEC